MRHQIVPPVECYLARRAFGTVLCVCLVGLLSARSSVAADATKRPAATPEQIEFFEKHVRPVLVTRCYKCHSNQAKKVQGKLKLDSLAMMLRGGESGPAIIPGKSAKSPLIEAIRYEDNEMPPKAKLPNHQIAAIAKWVDMGAPWPKSSGTIEQPTKQATHDWKKLRDAHWAFRPVKSPALPAVSNAKWAATPIDRFVLARLEAASLASGPAAERRDLIRRAYFDLIGLPPSPEEVAAFVGDKRSDAFARLIDRLLESPHYGERWGRHWLDLARYSDGFGGFLDSAGLAHAAEYRDWVVGALNRDMPYDQFVKNQIAGDVLPEGDGPLGTGFFAVGPSYRGDGGDPDATAAAKSETLDDRVDTFSRTFLALTISCARCHDHKFDPIPQLDYYSLAGVFNNSRTGVKNAVSRRATEHHSKIAAEVGKLKEQVKQLEAKLKDKKSVELSRLRERLEVLEKLTPPKPVKAHTLSEAGSRDMPLAIRGNLRRPGPIAPRRFLRVLAGEEPPKFTKGSGRLELAEAVASRDNPLTARVMVNRVWQHHFGQALVRTPSNFGSLGEKPSHPLLLDWLAAHLMDSGWSLKKLHRTIMLSNTYQTSARFDKKSFAADGDNRLLWRMNPRKLDVEGWRDSVLTVTGELDRRLGGASANDILRSKRRTLYSKVSRNGDRFPADTFLRLFDFPAPRGTSPKRAVSVVPQQFLFMMNNPFMIDRAKALTARLEKEQSDDKSRIKRAYQLLYSRDPTTDETKIGLAYLSDDSTKDSKLPAWQRYAQVLLSANELMYIR